MSDLDPMAVSPENIWQYEQNKPSLVAIDLERHGVPRDVTMRVLLARGVCKWLAARRDIIRQKNVWRSQITETLSEIREAKAARDRDRLHYLRGRLATLNECRQAVRHICHSERWRIPDHDRGSRKALPTEKPSSTEGDASEPVNLPEKAAAKGVMGERTAK